MASHILELESGPSRKRQKVTRACDNCKYRKKRCTGDKPCTPCQKSRSDCTYDAVYSRGTAVPPSPRQTQQSSSAEPHRFPAAQIDHSETPPHLGAFGWNSNVGSTTIARSGTISEPGVEARSRTMTEADGNERLDPASDPSLSPRPMAHVEAPLTRLTPEPGEAIDGQYHGSSSAQTFLGRVLRRSDHNSAAVMRPHQQHETDTAVLSFGDCSFVEPDISKFAWPDHNIATNLLNRYFEFASPTYRFAHEPTMHGWLTKIYSKSPNIPSSVVALVLLMFAAASMVQVDSCSDYASERRLNCESSEAFFAKAQQLLAEEIGPPRLESVQARFVTVQYLLSSSRPNKALYTFGTMVQLLQAIGLHRRHRTVSTQPDAIVVECRKRLFWSAFTLDKYLSIVMGRSPLLHLEDTNQELPAAVNDEDLSVDGVRPHTPGLRRDCLLHATIAHAELALILARALQEQHRLPGTADGSHVEAAVRRSEEIQNWQSRLTPILSGAIHPSSLIPSFRRQHGVLLLGRLHAVMFVTRPLLLRDLSSDLASEQVSQYRHQLQSCVQAAKDSVETIVGFARDKQLYPAFWHTQYIAFNAISIIYIYLIQLSRNHVPNDLFLDNPFMERQTLYDLAHTGQLHLAEASIKNAPLWRYNLILEGLATQTSKCIASESDIGKRATDPSLQVPLASTSGTATWLQTRSAAGDNLQNSSGLLNCPGMVADQMGFSWANITESMFDDLIAENIDNSLTMEFWPHFDSVPINNTTI